MGVTYLLYEHAAGFALFERVKSEQIGIELEEVQKAVADLKTFSMIMKMKAFLPFTSAESALENINAVSEGEITEFLANFLELNVKSSKKVTLGVFDAKMGNIISETLKIKCESGSVIQELLRGIRLHFVRFIKGLKSADASQAQLGLGHSYSRSKVKFNVHRVDNMIIQSICLLDQLDKDLNTFAMRVREWYGYHFPELVRIVNDNYKYAKCAKLIGNKSTLNSEKTEALSEILQDDDAAKQIVQAAKMSMGTDISPVDLINIMSFATRVVSLSEYRKKLYNYLCNKMSAVAPNLASLIGEIVGARLISHAGSLTSLAKYPASTVQILGAEKALFRALKTKGNTPKYGLIFHSPFIARASAKNKGRISRYLANKCSIASRIDCFSETPTCKFGEMLNKQVEERLEFYKTGATPRKNIEVMREACAAVAEEEGNAEVAANGDGAQAMEVEAEANGDKKKKKKKRKAEEEVEAAEKPAKKVKKSKKKKKTKK